MTDFFFVEGSWPLPMIRVDLHEPYQAAYYPSENEVRIDLPDCTAEYILLVLGHELVHWAHFAALRETENIVWSDALALDSSIFHHVRRSMELAACWFHDCPVPDHLLIEAERRRACRLVHHRGGRVSWRNVRRLVPITAEEKAICERLGALA